MTAWWSEERITATVKQEYIERELGSKRHVDKVHEVLAFGDGLTDDTYLDWILERSSRIFLTLNQIGVPEKIFEFIDKSFADDDLPLTQDALWELNLFGAKSETLDKKFYREQFNFLVQELEPGGHVDYGTWEVVPVDPVVPVVRRPSLAAGQASSDKVHLHKKLYTRKRVATPSEKGFDEVPFLMQLKALTNIQHAHLVSIWATYSQDDVNYILLHPPAETSLKVFLDEPPKAFKQLEKYERRNIMLTWTHCLTSALAYLHGQGLVHLSIRPSTIFIDHRNAIFLNDYSALRTLEVEETNSSYSNELYEHSAPENWLRKPCLHETAPLKTYLPGGGRTSRRIPKPVPPTFKDPLPLPPSPNPQRRRADSKSGSSGSSTNTRPRNAIITTMEPTQREGSIVSSSSSYTKRSFAADIFSHTTILLTLLSQILQHSPRAFASHRSRLNRQAGRGNAPPDCSFHKNLSQVNKWIDMLAKEAGQREKKDMKFWGAVVEVVQVCRLGIKREPKERIEAKDLEHKVAGWVHWGLSRRRKCNCKIKDEDEPPPVEVIERLCADEPVSKYRLSKLKSTKQHLSGTTGFGGPSSGGPKSPSITTSVNVGRGSTQPPSLNPSRLEFSSEKPIHPSMVTSKGAGRPSTQPTGADPSKESLVWGIDDLAHLHEGKMRRASIDSGDHSTVWGLGDIYDDYGDEDMDRVGSISSTKQNVRESGISISTSCIAEGVAGGTSGYDEESESDYSTETETPVRDDWPLPLGTLTLS